MSPGLDGAATPGDGPVACVEPAVGLVPWCTGLQPGVESRDVPAGYLRSRRWLQAPPLSLGPT